MLYPEGSMVNMMESSLAETMVSTSPIIIITIMETIRWQQKPTLGVVKCWPIIRGQLGECKADVGPVLKYSPHTSPLFLIHCPGFTRAERHAWLLMRGSSLSI